MLSAMAPHGREMSQDLRKKIISLHKKGEGYKKISKALLISWNTVAKVVKTFKKDGTATISQRRPGRPRKLTPRQERLLMRRVEENRHASSLQLSKEVESQTGVTISCDTIRCTLQRNGMHGCHPRKTPLLKPRHKKARLEFARAHADKYEDYWDSILWSDETKINVFGTDGFKTVWRRKDEEYKEKCMVLNTHLRSLLISEEEQGESDSVAKYVSWSEPNRTPMGNSEETSWASLSIQHPISKRGHSWRMEKDRSGKMSPTCSFHA